MSIISVYKKLKRLEFGVHLFLNEDNKTDTGWLIGQMQI